MGDSDLDEPKSKPKHSRSNAVHLINRSNSFNNDDNKNSSPIFSNIYYPQSSTNNEVKPIQIPVKREFISPYHRSPTDDYTQENRGRSPPKDISGPSSFKTNLAHPLYKFPRKRSGSFTGVCQSISKSPSPLYDDTSDNQLCPPEVLKFLNNQRNYKLSFSDCESIGSFDFTPSDYSNSIVPSAKVPESSISNLSLRNQSKNVNSETAGLVTNHPYHETIITSNPTSPKSESDLRTSKTNQAEFDFTNIQEGKTLFKRYVELNNVLKLCSAKFFRNYEALFDDTTDGVQRDEMNFNDELLKKQIKCLREMCWVLIRIRNAEYDEEE